MLRTLVAGAWVTAALASPAHAAGCAEPGLGWQYATPASQGLDKDMLDRAIHSYQDRRGFAVRIYRNGCLVGRDTNYGYERMQLSTWEITGSVLTLLTGRAEQLGLLSLDDPVGALVPEADAAHGAIRVRDLLTRTSGLAREADNSFVEDRLRRALTRPLDAKPGARFGDAPVARQLLAAVIERASGRDLRSFAAEQLFAPIGLSGWAWSRDDSGAANASFGLQAPADELARLAELVRRGGVWWGRRLLGAGFVAQMLAPDDANACSGWTTWLNAGERCAQAQTRLLPGMPADLWEWRGHNDQRVTVMPSLNIVIVRLGLQESGDQRAPNDEATWERDTLFWVLSAVRDVKPETTPQSALDPPITDEPFADDPAAKVADPPPLPPAGPRRARAPRLSPGRDVAGRRRLLGVRIRCLDDCAGTVTLLGAEARPKTFRIGAGATREVLVRLRARLAADRDLRFRVRVDDAAGGTSAELAFRARR